jgi:hypothetical protein
MKPALVLRWFVVVTIAVLTMLVGNRAEKVPEIPVYNILKIKPANSTSIKVFLKSQYGASAKITWDKLSESWEADTGKYKVSIASYKGHVLSITVHYNPPVSLSSALEQMGLPEKPATRTGTCCRIWVGVFKDIDEMNAVMPCFHGQATSGNYEHFNIIPNKGLYYQWSKQE